MEEWRDIDGFPGYQVSNTGKVRSFINNRYGIGCESHELKPVNNRHGYPTVCLGRGNRRLVSRLVASAYIPNPNNLPLIRHMDDNPQNNSVDNLKWGTQVDNMQDCVKHGRLIGNTMPAIESIKKPVIATSLDGTKCIRFASVNEAARELDLWPQHVSGVALGKLRQTGGWIFRYEEEGGYNRND